MPMLIFVESPKLELQNKRGYSHRNVDVKVPLTRKLQRSLVAGVNHGMKRQINPTPPYCS
jgi:hypothetical protein